MRNDIPSVSAPLVQAISATRAAEVIRDNSTPGRISLLCRVHRKRMWCEMWEYVLVRQQGWTEHLCQQYFLRGGKLVFGWNVIVQSSGSWDDDGVATEVAKLLLQAAEVVPQVVTAGPIESFPLVGASPRRTAKIVFDPRQPGPSQGGPSHKGAYGIRTPNQD